MGNEELQGHCLQTDSATSLPSKKGDGDICPIFFTSCKSFVYPQFEPRLLQVQKLLD